MIPGTGLGLGFQTHLESLVLLEQVQGQPPQATEVLRRVSFANAAGVFIETDIQTPMQPIFDPPVASDDLQQRGRRRLTKAAQKVPPLHGTLLPRVADRFDADEAGQPLPLRNLAIPGHFLGRPEPTGLRPCQTSYRAGKTILRNLYRDGPSPNDLATVPSPKGGRNPNSHKNLEYFS